MAYQTDRSKIKSVNPAFNDSKKLPLTLTQDLVEYVQAEAVSFEVWGEVNLLLVTCNL